MPDWIIKYWVQWLFGLIIAGLSFACRKIYKLYQSEKDNRKTKEQQQLQDSLESNVKKILEKQNINFGALQDEINVLKTAFLGFYHDLFVAHCQQLLDEDHEIELEEFENIQKEHNTYKSLGGNHDGDTLFEMVKQKAIKNITQ